MKALSSKISPSLIRPPLLQWKYGLISWVVSLEGAPGSILLSGHLKSGMGRSGLIRGGYCIALCQFFINLKFKWSRTCFYYFVIYEFLWYFFCMREFVIIIQVSSWQYNYLCNQCLSPLMLWVSIRARCTTLCDKVCQWLATGQWFSPGSLVSSTNKTDLLDITEILLKVALNTITL